MYNFTSRSILLTAIVVLKFVAIKFRCCLADTYSNLFGWNTGRLHFTLLS